MRRLLIFAPAILVLLTLLSGFALSQEWIDVRSTNLRMLTDGPAKPAREALWKMEQARVVFGHLLNRDKVNRNRPMLIIGLQSPSAVRALVGNATQVPGGFALSAEDRNYLVLELSATDWSGIYRAYALLMLNANYPRTQPWFDEGLAEYVAGLTIDPRQIQEGAPSEAAQTLRSGAPMPMEQLIAPAAETSPQFRAKAWLFFRWLVDNGQMENVGTYFNQVMNRGVAPVTAFQQSFSETPQQMDVTLAKFETAALAPKPIYKPVELDQQTFVVTKYPESEARAIEAQFKLDMPTQSEQGFNTLRQMLMQDPNNVEVNRGLGIGYLRAGDLRSAADHLRRAIEIRDNDALMHYLIGVIRNRGSREAIQVDSEGPTIEMQMKRAIDLDPELAEAYQLLAEGELATRHPAKALDSIRTGMTLSPRDEDLMLTFASVQMANSKYDEARGMLRFLQASHDPQISKRAGEMLVSATHLSKSEQHWAEQGMKYTDPTAPQWRPTKTEEEAAAEAAANDKPVNEAKPDMRKTEYVKGTLLSVQCPDEKNATLTVSAGKKRWTFKIADRSKALLIGVDNFQCSWKDVPVSINYRASGMNEGDLVSLEVD